MQNLKAKDIKRQWHLIDAKDKILGRLSSQVAHLLMGKNKPYYTPYMDCGDFVVVVNAAKINLSGKKESQKIYFSHSLYPGGLSAKTAAHVRSSRPEELIRHAVVGMLPKNKLTRIMVKKLYVYPEKDNPHQAKFSPTELKKDKESK